MVNQALRGLRRGAFSPALFLFDHPDEEIGYALEHAVTKRGHLYASAPEWIYGSVSGAPWVLRPFSNFRGCVGVIICISAKRSIIAEAKSVGLPVMVVAIEDPTKAAEIAAQLACVLEFMATELGPSRPV